MKGFSETVTVDLPLIVDYTMTGDGLVITQMYVAGTCGTVAVSMLPEKVQDKIIAEVSASIRAYEEERKTLPVLP